MKKGLSITELLIVTAIICGVLALVFAGFLGSDRSWRTGRNKLIGRQEARKIVDSISQLLKRSSTNWDLSDEHYGVTLSEDAKRLDFYVPVTEDGVIVSLRKVTFKLDPDNPRQLLCKQGNDPAAVVSQFVEDLSFTGGCAGCVSYDCASVADDCPTVKIDLRVRSEESFSIVSQVSVRNYEQSLLGDVSVEAPEEGEF